MTHEFGHTLGATLHDDEFYDEDRASSLIMWSAVIQSSYFKLLINSLREASIRRMYFQTEFCQKAFWVMLRQYAD